MPTDPRSSNEQDSCTHFGQNCIRSLFSRLFAEIYEFCRSAFLGLLLAGLAIIALLRFLLRFIKDSTREVRQAVAFVSGLFLLLCISR